MSKKDSRSEPNLAASEGKGGASASQGRQAASPPASTTDLGRFPEHPEAGDITSLLGGGASGEAPAQTPGAPQDSRTQSNDPSLDFDSQIKIERRLGAGGMGEVFLGYQKHLDRKVAVKRIRAWDADTRARERFIQEAKAQSKLRHPGIAQVYDFRESGDSFHLVMEYVPGKTLEELQAADEKFAPDRIARIGVQLTEALESAAHEGYIHRDLKPGNVMLSEDGKVKIIDFGLALRFRNLMQTRFTQKGDLLGTPAYMSPEQLNQEENLDVRSDIWSLGVLLYALATGAPPFTGKDFACTLRNVMIAEPAPLTTIEPGFPPELWQTIAKALKKDRPERWQDYASFRAALLRATGPSSQGTDDGPRDSALGSAPRRSMWSFARLPVVAASTLFLGLLVTHIHTEARKLEIREQNNPTPPKAVESQKSESALPPAREGSIGNKVAAGAPDVKTAAAVKAGPASPPRLSLRGRLIASPPSGSALRWMEHLQGVFERHSGAMAGFSYDGIAAEIEALKKGDIAAEKAPLESEDCELVAAFLRGSERMIDLARGALRARLEELRRSSGPVTLRLRAGGTITGSVATVATDSITLRGETGQSTLTELGRISPEEFRPKAAPEAAELAFQALSIQPSRTLPALLDLEANDEEVLLWLPAVVRLARLEVESKSREAAAQAKPLLLENRAPENSTAYLASWIAAKASEEFLIKAESRMPSAFVMLSQDFAKAKAELVALQLLFHRQFSRAAALHSDTAAGVVAAALVLELFEKDLATGSDELLEGSGWFNWRWELRPTHPDVKERRKYLLPKPDEEIVILQDEDGPRSLVMNDITSRAPEGILLRVRLAPFGNRPEAAEWRIHLLSENGGSSYLRFGDRHVEVYRSTLISGATDLRLAQAPMPSPPVEQRFRTIALVPGGEHLHVFVNRQFVFSIPREDGSIPKQLALVVLHGKLSVRNLQARRAPAPDGGSRK